MPVFLPENSENLSMCIISNVGWLQLRDFGPYGIIFINVFVMTVAMLW
jgi:hypothetical protein